MRAQGGSSVARVARHVARWNSRAESVKPQGRGTQTAFRQQVQDESDRHVVTLDEKDDQKVFHDDSSLQRMRRLSLVRDEDQARLRIGTHARSRIRERLDGKTEMTILRVRLETAGEAKILYKLTLGEMNTNIPVIGIMMTEHHAH